MQLHRSPRSVFSSIVRRARTSLAAGCAALAATAASLLTLAGTAPAQTPGDVAIIGWIDNGSPADSFAFVALAQIDAGTSIYFTDNGWTGSVYRGATATSGVGNEQVLKFLAVNNIAAGTVIRTTDTSADFSWITGAIGGGITGSYSVPALTTSGDQLYAFTSTAANALFNPTHLFVLDDTGAFEPATNPNQGDVPPTLTAGVDALTFAQSGSGQNFMAFDTNALACGTKAQWLAAIANSANWSFGAAGALPGGALVVGGPDSDGDGVLDCADGCPVDPSKVAPGQCGCGVADTDTDGDGTADCNDACPSDPLKVVAGDCGCGVADTDTDGDGTADCNDGCINDPNKTAPGGCGCGVVDVPTTYYPDTDGDGFGNAALPLAGYTCSVPPGYVLDNTDCDDAQATVHPGHLEICGDGLDNDCNGTADDFPTPSDVYVDDSWSASAPGTDPDGAGPAQSFGCDAFATIQAGIGAVASGGTVHVAAGDYVENVVVAKSVTLAGAGQGLTFVRPAFSGPVCAGGSLCAGGSYLVLVQANNVVVRDMTLDGDNPALTSGYLAGGVDVDARNGIITNHALGVFQNLVVHHVTLQNIWLRGIYASSGGSFSFHDCLVDNVRGEAASIGMFNFGGSGVMQNNTLSNCNDAMASNWSTGTQYLGNQILASGSGIHTDNAGGVADLVQGNTVTNCSWGIWVFAPFTAPTVDRNLAQDCYVGLACAGRNGATPVQANFTYNRVDGQGSGGNFGVYVTTDRFGFGSTDVDAHFRGNEVHGTDYGFLLESQAGYALRARLDGNAIYDNALAGVYDDASGTNACDASGNWWGSASGPSGLGLYGALAGTGDWVDALVDFTPWLDSGADLGADPLDGFQGDFATLHVDDDSLQSGVVGRIQEGIDLTSASTVLVSAGTYPEFIEANQAVSILGPHANTCPGSSLDRGGEAVLMPGADASLADLDRPLVYVTSDDVTLKGLTLTGDNPSLSGQPVGAGTAEVDNLVANGAFDDDVTYPFVDVEHLVIENNILTSANDIAINLYNGGSIGSISENNSISCNRLDNLAGTNVQSPGSPYNRIAVLVYNSTYAVIDDNYMTAINIGVQTGNNHQANGGTAASISDNTIFVDNLAIWHNLHYSAASAFTIAGNHITANPAHLTDAWGVYVSSIMSAVPVVVSGNDLTGGEVGIAAWNNPTTSNITVQGGLIQNCALAGVQLRNTDDGYGAAAATTMNVDGVTTTNCVNGIRVAADPAGTNLARLNVSNAHTSGGTAGVLATGGPLAQLYLSNSLTTLSGASYGVDVDGARARIETSNLSGNAVAGLRVRNGGLCDAGDPAASNFSGLGSSVGGNVLTGYGFDNAAPWAIEDQNTNAQPNVLALLNDFGALAGDDVEDVVYDDTDNSGNSQVFASQGGGLLIACPAGMTVDCVAALPVGATTLAAFQSQGGTSTASPASVSFSDALTGSAPCSYLITRTYTVTDTNANSAQCDQLISVLDTTPPTLTAPLAATIECDQSTLPANTGMATGADNCGGAVTFEYVDVVVPGACPNAYTLQRTWTAKDVCNNASLPALQIITVQDTTAPVIAGCPSDITTPATPGPCAAAVTWTPPTATDNCGAANLVASHAPGSVFPAGTTTVTYTATDDCGNAALPCSFNVTVTAGSPVSVTYVDDAWIGTTPGTDPDGAGPAQSFGCDAFATIQGGVNAVSLGGTVYVLAGLYEEQVVIQNSGLQLIGSGSGTNPAVDSIVRAPTTLSYSFASSANNYPVVAFHDCTGWAAQDLRIDGFGRANGNYRMTGLGLYNAGGSVTNVDVTGIRETPINGNQQGVGILAFNNTGGPYSLALDGCDVDGYQKNGMTLAGNGLTVSVSNCVVTGAGPVSFIAQNGIQVGSGAGGVISNCVVSGHVFTPATYAAAGILPVLTDADVDVVDCTLTNNAPAIYYYDAPGNVLRTTMDQSAASAYDGMYLVVDASDPFVPSTPPYRKPDAFNVGPWAQPETAASAAITVTQCVITGNAAANSSGVYVYSAAASAVASIAQSDIGSWDYGVYSYEDAGGVNGVTVFGNDLSGNVTAGTASVTASAMDASGNWWGSNVAAAVSASATSVVDYTPWLDSALDTSANFAFQGDFSSLHVDDDSPQSGTSGRVQEGEDRVLLGGMVRVEPGTYVENVVIDQRCTIDGAGSGGNGAANPATDTIVQAASSGAPAIAIDASGLGDLQRLVVSHLRTTGGSDGVGVVNTPRAYLRLEGVTSVGNSNGVHFGATGGVVSDVELVDCVLSNNSNTGLRIASATSSTTGLHVTGGEVQQNVWMGFSFNPSGLATCVGDDITFDGTSFANNGAPTQSGTGHLSFFGFNGSAQLRNLTLSGATRVPLQFRGIGSDGLPGTWSALGTVAIDNVTISGACSRPGVYIQLYTSLSGVTLSGLDLSGLSSTNAPGTGFAVGMQLDHTGAPLALADTLFPCQGGQSAGYVGLAVVNVGGATADCTTDFGGAVTHPEKEACIFDINDVAGPYGDVVIEPAAAMWYADQDGDTYGDPLTSVQSCTQPSGYVANNTDTCPLDNAKQAPGTCGCGVSDIDSDGDGTADCNDLCPADPNKVDPGICGCGVSDIDSDGDGTADCNDLCPADPNKVAPGICGCGVSDADSDGDGTADCNDLCPADPNKVAPGFCGCGTPETDTDQDGTPDCIDSCPFDPNKVTPGICGCGISDVDSDGDSFADCIDNCPTVANPSQSDHDGDQVGDLCDNCPLLANPGQEDCDNDNLGDRCAIALGLSLDCNNNDIPDECDVAAQDCNGNGTPDDCDIASGFSLDLNFNLTPDECEVSTGTPFCFGDGTGVPCPCGNSGLPGEGCANSTGRGSLLYNLGGNSLSADDAYLVASHVQPAQSGIMFAGVLQVNGGLGHTLYDGLLCVTPLIRYGVRTSTGMGAIIQTNLVAGSNALITSGSTWNFQSWYRDPTGGPCNTTANLSNALQLTFVP